MWVLPPSSLAPSFHLESPKVWPPTITQPIASIGSMAARSCIPMSSGNRSENGQKHDVSNNHFVTACFVLDTAFLRPQSPFLADVRPFSFGASLSLARLSPTPAARLSTPDSWSPCPRRHQSAWHQPDSEEARWVSSGVACGRVPALLSPLPLQPPQDECRGFVGPSELAAWPRWRSAAPPRRCNSS